MLAGERHQGVRDGLARLRTLDRQTLEAFYVKGRSLKQMSGDFRAPLGTIKRRLHVARQRLGQGSGILDRGLNGAGHARSTKPPTCKCRSAAWLSNAGGAGGHCELS